MQRQPSASFANIKKRTVHAFLGAGPRIKVIRKYLVPIAVTLMNNDLLPVKMRMPKWRRKIDHGVRREIRRKTFDIHDLLNISQGCRKECRISWGDQ